MLACRSVSRGQAAVQAIKKQVPSADVSCMELDLASLTSVRQFVGVFGRAFPKLNLLVNNAGVGGGGSGGVTSDGIELNFGVNYLGHYLLTMLLLPRLQEGHRRDGKQSRIINLSSVMHVLADSKNWPKTDDDKSATTERASDRSIDGREYARSKLYMIVLTHELNRRLSESGEPGIVSHAVNPGAVNSDIWRNAPSKIQPIVKKVFPLLFKTSAQGALTTLSACMRQDLPPGSYLVDRKLAKTSSLAKNRDLARWLWKRSEVLTGEGWPW